MPKHRPRARASKAKTPPKETSRTTGLSVASWSSPPASMPIQADPYLASIIESAMDAIMTIDEDQRIVLFNAAAEHMFGCPAAEALGGSVDRFIPERFRAEHRRAIRAFAASGETHRRMGQLGQVIGLRGDGSEFPLESSISLAKVEGRTLLTVIHRDITNRVQAERELAKERALVSTILDTAGALVVVLDPEGRIVRFNRACETVTGYTIEEVRGRRVWDLLCLPEEVESVQAVFRALRSGHYPNEHQNYWLTKRGERRYLAWSNTVLIDDSGAVDAIVGIGLDITERRKAETLQAEEAMLLTMIGQGAPLTDILNRICLFVEEYHDGCVCALFEYVHGDFRCTAAPSFPEGSKPLMGEASIKPDLIDRLLSHRERVFVADLTNESFGESIRAIARTCALDGCWIIPIFSSARRAMLGALTVFHREAKRPTADETNLLDVAASLAGIACEQQRNQEALQQSHDALKALTARLLTAQDDERRRISRELHDDVNQRLAVLALTVQAAQHGLAPSDPTYAVLQQCYDELAALSEDIRRLAHHLHPSVLDDLGLEVALRAYADDFAKREGLAVTFTAERVPTELSKDVASCLYRIGQESLRNVAKHARASHVTIALQGSQDGVTLTITDDGVGFDTDRVRATGRGLGLIGMQERVRLVNGIVTIQSRSGKGTSVSAWVPIPRRSS